MNRRTMLGAALVGCVAPLVPERKSPASPPTIRVRRRSDPYNDLCMVARRQIFHVRQAGMTPTAIRFGRREREVFDDNSVFINAWSSDVWTFAGIPIHWTDNECEIAVDVGTEENTE